MSALPRRVLAAAVLIPLVVAAVIGLPTWAFALAFGVFALLGAWEWPAIAALEDALRGGFWVGTIVLMGVLALAWGNDLVWGLCLLSAILFWCLALVWVIQAQHGEAPSGLSRAPVRMLAGWFTLIPAWAACVTLHARSPILVLLLLVVIWLADIAAYFAGRQFGRRRLASRISPGKSWEGVLAGLVVVGFGAWLVHTASLLPVSAPGPLIALCVMVAAVSVLGDLSESLFKRRAGVKDSGTLIPGHGGMLDRIDSLTAAAPAFTVGWLTLGLELP